MTTKRSKSSVKKKENHLKGLTVDNMHIKKVRSFSCLGTIINGNGTLKEDIRERNPKENKTFYGNKTLFKSNLMSKNSN